MMREIYALALSSDPALLTQHFSKVLGMPESLAKKFATNYHPEHEPRIIADQANLSSSEIFKELSAQVKDLWPKNELAWWIMKHLFGSEVFDFQILGDNKTLRKVRRRQHKDNSIHFRNYFFDTEGKGLSHGRAALLSRECFGLPPHVRRKAGRMLSELGSEAGVDLFRALKKADCSLPPNQELASLCAALNRGLRGEEVLLTGVFCPDYAYRETPEASVPYQYTFDNVGGGVGLVALQIERILPALIEYLKRYGIPYRVVLAIADFEANDPLILTRVGKTRDQFLALCEESLRAFQSALPGVPMELKMFERDLADGRLQRYEAEALTRMEAGDFGAIHCRTGKSVQRDVDFLAADRRSFYEKWFGHRMTEVEAYNLLLKQGAEYAACGRILLEIAQGKPAIKVAGDSPRMQLFSSFFMDEVAIGTIAATRQY